VYNVKIAQDVLLQEDGGDAFLLHVETGRFFGLNRSGLAVWRALEGGRDPLGALGDRWPDVPAEQHRADLDALVAALLAAGLVHDDE
jgi:Coenzyme PQQ synthesis protein D (PqqD)